MPWEPTTEMGVVEGGGAMAEGARWLLLLFWVDLAFCTGNASAVWKDKDRDIVLVANYKMEFGFHIYAKNTGQRVIICTRGKILVPVQHFRIRKMAQKLWDIADRHIILCNVSDIPLKPARRQD